MVGVAGLLGGGGGVAETAVGVPPPVGLGKELLLLLLNGLGLEVMGLVDGVGPSPLVSVAQGA